MKNTPFANFNETHIRIFVEFLISDKALYEKHHALLTNRLIKHLDDSLPKTGLAHQYAAIRQYYNDYGDIPQRQILRADTNVEFIGGDGAESEIDTESADNVQWFLDHFRQFALQVELLAETADIREDLQNGKNLESGPERLQNIIDRLTTWDLGTEVLADTDNAVARILKTAEKTPSGWKSLDDKLDGGFEKKELHLFVAPSNAGKSLVLENLAYNYAHLNKPALLISTEMTEADIDTRFLSMYTGLPMPKVRAAPDKAREKLIEAKQREPAKIFMKSVRTRSITALDIRRLIREHRAEGNPVEVVIVDYIDQMLPNSGRLTDKVFQNDDLISNQLRDVAVDEDVIMITASQTNREGAAQGRKGQKIGQEHIAGGHSKHQTAGTVIGIARSADLDEKKRIEFQISKTRKSGGAGNSTQMEVNWGAMRIFDWKHPNHFDEMAKAAAGEDDSNQAAWDVLLAKTPAYRQHMDMGVPTLPSDDIGNIVNKIKGKPQ